MSMQIKRWGPIEALRAQLDGCRWLLCVDLEATCDAAPPGLEESARADYPLQVPPGEMETIELGAVLIDLHEGRVVDEFGRFVRPALHPTLTEFCTGLTGITQADVDAADSFAMVDEALAAWLAPRAGEGWRWCSWGNYDCKQIEQDAARHSIFPTLEAARHINLKKCFWKAYRCRALGLRPAVEALGMTWEGSHHRGIDDARNLARVAQQMVAFREGAQLLNDHV